jgi:tetratricopeptide (TPR) repeat protein
VKRASLFLLCLAPILAFSADLDKADKELQRVEAELPGLKAKFIGTSKELTAEEVQKRIRDGQTYFLLKDYVRSSILLFDIVEDPKNKTHPGYTDAIYYLAESLYRNGNTRGARGFYQELSLTENAYRPDALLRLLEAAIVNEEESRIDELLLDTKDVTSPSGTLHHMIGKALFLRGRLDESFASFSRVPETDDLALAAKYYQGVVRLAQAKKLLDAARTPEKPMFVPEDAARVLDEAREIFIAATNMSIRPEQTELLWMSHLALGRIYHELGKEDDAAKEYLAIPTSSESFAASRYEAAWVFIAQNDLKRAYTNLESMRLFVKEGPIVAETMILQGSLLSNLKRYPEALNQYQDLRQIFTPIEKQINETLSTAQQPEDLIKTRLEKEGLLDARDLLPPLARAWMEPSDLVKRSLELQEDLRLIDANIKECNEIAALLESKLSGKSSIESFPILNDGRQKGLSLLDVVYASRDEAVSVLVKELAPLATPAEKAKLDELGKEQQRVEDLFKTIPKSKDSYKEREKKFSERFSELLRRQHQMALRVDGLSARLVALRKYYNDTKAEKNLTPEQDADFILKIDRLEAINVTLAGFRRAAR